MPQDVRCELTLKPRKIYDYFVLFGYGALISLVLNFSISTLFILIFVICLVISGFFGLMVVIGGKYERRFRNIDKILITGSGFALVNYQGMIEYEVPFSSITGVRYWYREHAISVALNMGARVPTAVQFVLADKDLFTITIDDIVEPDRKKAIEFLPGFRRMFPLHEW
jgi:hypothetical protein